LAKLVLSDITSLESQPSAIQTLNLNFELIAEAFETVLSRDGTSPNQMEAPLDLNDQRLMNVGAPVSSNDVARLVDLQEALAPEGVLIPTLVSGRILSNDGTVLTWVVPSTLPGIGNMLSTNNLSELSSVATARTNLGLGTSATVDTGTSGATLGLLSADKQDSGANTYSGALTYSGGAIFGGAGSYRLTSTVVVSDSIGFRGAPTNTQDATYTLVLTDAGKTILHTSASTHTWTIPPNSSAALPIGSVIVLANTGSGAVTIARGAGVALRVSGSATDANKTLAQHGIASIIKLGTDSWYISGSGLS
jgi:hypothetical protein